MINLSAPPIIQGTPQQQMEAMRSYLYQMHRDLNIALDMMQRDMQAIAGEDETQASASSGKAKAWAAEAENLKALIIKTAKTVNRQMDELERTLEGTYVAISDFGQYQEDTRLEIRETATEVVLGFSYQSTIEALRDRVESLETENTTLYQYRVETEQYTKSGLLYYEDNIPVYGYAVGEVLTRVIENGEEVVRKEDLLATFSSGQLNFWQGGNIVAYYRNNRMYVMDGEFLRTLQIGDWVLSTTNGRLDFDWAGDEV